MAELQTLQLKNGTIINADDYDESQHALAGGQKAPTKDPKKLGPNDRRVIMHAERAPSDIPTSDAIRIQTTVPVMKVRLHSSGQEVVINRAEFNPSLHTALLDDAITRASSFIPSATDPLRPAGTGVAMRNVGVLGGTEVQIDSVAERTERARASNKAAADEGAAKYDPAGDAAEASRKAAAAVPGPAKAPAKAAGKGKATAARKAAKK